MEALHLDQSVPSGAVLILRQHGHAAVTARDLGMRHADDALHLLEAALQRRILVTRDNDFLSLHIAWHDWPRAWGVQPLPEHAGILIVSSQWRAVRAAQEIESVLQQGWPLTNVLYRYETPPGDWVQH